jgi:hypothetical protein
MRVLSRACPPRWNDTMGLSARGNSGRQPRLHASPDSQVARPCTCFPRRLSLRFYLEAIHRALDA